MDQLQASHICRWILPTGFPQGDGESGYSSGPVVVSNGEDWELCNRGSGAIVSSIYEDYLLSKQTSDSVLACYILRKFLSCIAWWFQESHEKSTWSDGDAGDAGDDDDDGDAGDHDAIDFHFLGAYPPVSPSEFQAETDPISTRQCGNHTRDMAALLLLSYLPKTKVS